MLKHTALKIHSLVNGTCALLVGIAILSTPTMAKKESNKTGTAALTRPGFASPKRTRVETERRVVASGVSTRVLSLVGLDAECNSVELPEMEILSGPRYGRTRVIAEEGFVKLGEDSAFHKKCSNKSGLMMRLYYKSNPGFRGRDEIIARGTWTELSYGTRTFKLIIDVR